MVKTDTKKRRIFDEAFKRRIVEEAAKQPQGQVQKYLEEQSVTPSHYYQWRAAFELKDAKSGLSSHRAESPSSVSGEIRDVEISRLTLMLTQSLEREQMFRKQLQEITTQALAKSA